MSTHNECGASIHWARRPDDMDRFLPPLEFVGVGYIIDDGVGIETSIYKQHHCDPADVLRWAEYKAKLAEIEERKVDVQDLHEEQLIQRAMRKERIDKAIAEEWDWALKVDCPVLACSAQVNEYCMNLTEKRKGKVGVRIKYPHQPRSDLSGWTKHIRDLRKELNLT